MKATRLASLIAVFLAVQIAAPVALAADGWADKGKVVRLKNKKDKVGVGTKKPLEKLQVQGAVRYFGVKEVDEQRSAQAVRLKRYVVEATKGRVDNTVPLDNELLDQLCRDVDGCSVTLGMRDWDDRFPGSTASIGPLRLFASRTSNWWRVSSGTPAEGGANREDRNAGADTVMEAWNCIFTDGEIVNRNASDVQVGFGLYNTNDPNFGPYIDPDMVCVLIIDD